MRPGSVVVDVAAPTGGNCEVTVPGETVDVNGVTVLGPQDLAGLTATHASEMYSRNVFSLLDHLTDDDGNLVLDPDDEISTCAVVKEGEIANERVRSELEGGS
jgi:NAD(P) transhydrogenase subunit alpha